MAPSNDDGAIIPTPPSCKTVKEIGSVKDKSFVNVIGFVKDFREPRATASEDWKCTMQIVDHSVGDQDPGVDLSMFWPQKYLPSNIGNRTIAIIQQAKVQYRGNTASLLTNFKTRVYLIPLFKVKQESNISPRDLDLYIAPGKDVTAEPSLLELMYAKSIANRVDELLLPSAEEFETRAIQSVNVKDKFCLLKDVMEDGYYNIMGEVVKIYPEDTDRTSVYLTDYTANSKFYDYPRPGISLQSVDDEGDMSGFVRSPKKDEKDWPGPHGKMTIQLSLFDEHAAAIHEGVKPGKWVLLSNVQVRFGKNKNYLEGFLHGGTGAFEGRKQVKIINAKEAQHDDLDRYKEALRRKQDCEKKAEKQKHRLLEEELRMSKKRKGDDEELVKENSKDRRKKKRAGLEKKVAESEAEKRRGLNENIRCNFQDQHVVPIKEILKYELLHKSDGVEIFSPFTVRQYQANVRVVDYWPYRLEDFAVGRRTADMDALSEYSGGEDTDREEDRSIRLRGEEKSWEWRFELQVEDAGSSGSKDRIWLTVDNLAAQGLLALKEDAACLRSNPDLLAKLREQLFKLWGDLEEKKSAQLKLERTTESNPNGSWPSSSFSSIQSSSSPTKKVGAQPSVDSDAEDEEMDRVLIAPQSPAPEPSSDPRNKAFTCCIKQYGIMVDEEDPDKASAGDGKRWQRKFGLFDTVII